MAFGLLYMLMALVGKAGSDIKYGIDRVSAREQARERGSDTYIDGRGITRTVDGNKAVSFYHNNCGETLLLDKNGNRIKTYNPCAEDNYSIITAVPVKDSKGEWLFGDIPNCHKNFHRHGRRYKDLKTGEYIFVRAMELDDSIQSKINKHYFYINPYTLEIIRETDGEIELRNRGNRFSPSIEKVNEFIEAYNKKQRERYNPYDFGEVTTDRCIESINMTMWNQSKEKEKLS